MSQDSLEAACCRVRPTATGKTQTPAKSTTTAAASTNFLKTFVQSEVGKPKLRVISPRESRQSSEFQLLALDVNTSLQCEEKKTLRKQMKCSQRKEKRRRFNDQL
jgi:hypothetical protein